MNRHRLAPPLLALLLAMPALARADVVLPPIFGDHMVLQRAGTAPVWGTADPGETVTVTAGTVKETVTTGTDGAWRADLKGLAASAQPIDVTVQGKNTVVFHDVLVGDVWLCSGQSNMQFGVGARFDGPQLPPAVQPQIRLFYVPMQSKVSPVTTFAAAPRHPLAGAWRACTPETLLQDGDWAGFPAVAYYFAREVQAFAGAPVGLIASCVGGTSAHFWTSEEALAAVPELKPLADKAADVRKNFDALEAHYRNDLRPEWEASSKQWKEDHKADLDAYAAALKAWQEGVKKGEAVGHEPFAPQGPAEPADPATDIRRPAALFNGMIAPLIPYGLKGVVWYQGENDTEAFPAARYRASFPALIDDWRARWGQGDFPFLFVQLPNAGARTADPNVPGWASLREAQTQALSLPATGMAVTIDVGDVTTIHPPDKLDVAHRVALVARRVAYGLPGDDSGPVFRDMAVEGGTIRINFDHAQGLAVGQSPDAFWGSRPRPAQTGVVSGFAIAGKDGRFVWADSVIQGESVVVSSPQVPSPAAVRYGWSTSPACNLYNGAGLPAAPFRSDGTLPPAVPQ